MGKLDPSIPCWWECKLLQLLWKIVWQFLEKINIVTIWPSNSTPGYIPENWKLKSAQKLVHRCLYQHYSKWKHCKYPSTDEQINKLWPIHTMDYYSATERNEILINTTTWKSLEDIMLNEGGQTQKAIYCMIPSTWNTQNRQIHRDRKEINGCPRLGEGGMGRKCLMGTGFPFGGDGNILELESSDGCTTIWKYYKILNCEDWLPLFTY